ncbi:MAG: hypothetical protein M3371_11295 [Acidobacteriota bacterium]|nr:hypothetical protein [Acidobacteriota bacterium]
MSRLTAAIWDRNEHFFGLAERPAEADGGESAKGVSGQVAASFRLVPADALPGLPSQLPALATAGDVREAIRFLKKRPAGVGLVEAQGALKKPIFDARKVAAYEFWGLVTRDGERLRLSALGREFARLLEPEAHVFRRVLRDVEAYHAALAWIDAEASEIVTHTNVAAFWCAAHPEIFEQCGEKDAEAQVVSFFHLCQAAELGWLTIGKRGQPARLRVEREELTAYLTPSERSNDGPPHVGDQWVSPLAFSESDEPCAARQQMGDQTRSLRVYVSGGRGTKFNRQLRDALTLAGIENEAGDTAEDNSASLRTRTSAAMRRCEAGVFIITAADCLPEAENNRSAFDGHLLMEISAAFMLYDRRVILLCETSVEVPPPFRDLRRIELRGEELTWEAGVKLLKALKSLQLT